MNIAIISDNKKKELTTELCVTYCGILSKHSLCATNRTGKYIEEATGLQIEKLLTGSQGGVQQIASRIMYGEIDMVLYIRDPEATHSAQSTRAFNDLLRICDIHNIPISTNIATSKILITELLGKTGNQYEN